MNLLWLIMAAIRVDLWPGFLLSSFKTLKIPENILKKEKGAYHKL